MRDCRSVSTGRERVDCLDRSAKMFDGCVGVDHRCGDRGVAQDFPDVRQGDIPLHHDRSSRMPERMQVNILREPGQPNIFLEPHRECMGSVRGAALSGENSVRSTRKELQDLHRPGAERDIPFAESFETEAFPVGQMNEAAG